jgi:hypothetical protein
MFRYFYDNCKEFIIESVVLGKVLIPLEELNNYDSGEINNKMQPCNRIYYCTVH